LYNLGILENRKNNQVAAMNYFKKSIKEDSSYCPSYYQIGLIKYQQKQYSASLSNFRDAAMGTCMESAGAHYYQGLSLLGLKRYMGAQMKFDEIRKGFVTSGNAASLNLIAEVLKRQGVINQMQVPYRPGYAPQVQQPKQPGFQQDQQQQQQSQPQQPQQPQPQQSQQEEVIPLEKDAKKYKSYIDALKSDSPGIFDKFLEKKFK
jgi:tetratricopeptide (TPR) repeat protein